MTKGNKKSYICDKCNFELFHIDLYDEAKDMYSQSDCDIYEGPNADDFEKVGSLKTNEAIEVIGVVEEYNGEDTYWVVYKDKDVNEVFVSGAYVDTKPIAQTYSSSGSGNNSSNKQPSGSQQQSSSNGNQSMIDKLRNTKSNTNYNTSGQATGENGHEDSGINWN